MRCIQLGVGEIFVVSVDRNITAVEHGSEPRRVTPFQWWYSCACEKNKPLNNCVA